MEKNNHPSASKPIFVPLLDNGNGSVMSSFMADHLAAFSGREIHTILASDSHANRGMNKIANAFLLSDCDIWINIDADIRFTKNHIDRLLDHHFEKDVLLVYGLYPKKSDETEPCLCTFNEVPVPDDRGLARVRRSGRGFMLVHRQLLERMKEDNGGPALRYHNHGRVEWDFFPSGPVTGEFSAFGNETDEEGRPKREWISEDWYFCERARALGVPTLVDVGIPLGHVGLKEYRFSGKQTTNVDPANVKSFRDIDGWFDYEDFYRYLVRQIPEGGSFLEVGSWLGRSIAGFIAFSDEAKKSIKVYAVDTFEGRPANAQQEAILNLHGGNVFPAYRANLDALGISTRIETIIEESTKAAIHFADASLDAVFIDGDHSPEAVFADICSWSLKVKRGGIVSGHDIDEEGVREGVERFFGKDGYETRGRCWVVKW